MIQESRKPEQFSSTQPRPVSFMHGKSEFGNLSTSRVHDGEAVRQFNADEPDSQRSQRSCKTSREVFRKLKDLEFENSLYQLQMSHINKRKGIEEQKMRIQLQQLQEELHYIRNRMISQKPSERTRQSSVNSERGSDSSSSSSDSLELKKYSLTQESPQKPQDNKSLINKFQQLSNSCKFHDKLQSMFRMYCGSIKTIELDIVNKNLSQLLENVLQMLIDLIDKFQSIKIDQLKYKDVTPDKPPMNFEFETFNKEKRQTKAKRNEDSLSPVFNSNEELSEMRMKLSDHYDRIERIDIDQTLHQQQPQQTPQASSTPKPQLYKYQRPPMIQTSQSNSNSNTIDMVKSDKSSRRQSKKSISSLVSRQQRGGGLMPSLKASKHR